MEVKKISQEIFSDYLLVCGGILSIRKLISNQIGFYNQLEVRDCIGSVENLLLEDFIVS